MRCGLWGHRSGDRECALKDSNPADYARQMREDPMNSYVHNTTIEPTEMTAEEIDAEEARLLGSLSKREMKLLIRKLKAKVILEPK